MACSANSPPWPSTNCPTITSKPIAPRSAPLPPKGCWRRRENISTPPTCKSCWPATVRRSNPKPPSSATSKSSTPKANAWSNPLPEEDDDREDQSQEDEIKREDGLVRYWMFFNGEQVRLFSALAAAFFGVLWCFLYVLGAGRSV